MSAPRLPGCRAHHGRAARAGAPDPWSGAAIEIVESELGVIVGERDVVPSLVTIGRIAAPLERMRAT